jgi:hypothetical protein
MNSATLVLGIWNFAILVCKLQKQSLKIILRRRKSKGKLKKLRLKGRRLEYFKLGNRFLITVLVSIINIRIDTLDSLVVVKPMHVMIVIIARRKKITNKN